MEGARPDMPCSVVDRRLYGGDRNLVSEWNRLCAWVVLRDGDCGDVEGNSININKPKRIMCEVFLVTLVVASLRSVRLWLMYQEDELW